MEILAVLKDYLKIPKTDFALFMTGEWGSGKTYFLKNQLFKTIRECQVSEQPIKEKHLEFYEPIYVSLFGISTIREVEKRLLLELNPKLKSKPALMAGIIVRRFSNYFGLFGDDDVRDWLSIYKVPKQKVLCFDDLERIDGKIINETLGFINTIVEHQNIKVIIIAAESELQKKIPLFERIKEKTIRFTYKFTPDVGKAFDSFADTYNEAYRVFLKDNRDFICELYSRGQHHNLRTLKFNLDLFLKIFTLIEEFVVDNKYKSQVIDRLLFFTTVYSIEYKKNIDIIELSKLKEVNSENIMFSSLPNMRDFLFAKKITVEEPDDITSNYLETFTKTYLPFDDHYFQYFEVIAEFALTGFLNKEAINSDCDEILSDLIRKEASKETPIIQKLSGYLMLNDDELTPLISTILDKVEMGEFELAGYPNIFLILMQVESFKIEEFRIEGDTMEKFKRGIDISKHRAKYVESFRFKIPRWSGNDPRFETIAEMTIQANESLLDLRLKENAQRIIPLIEANSGKELYDYILNSENSGKPFFFYLDPTQIFDKIQASDNSSLLYFNNGIYDRNLKGYVLHNLNKEKKFFIPFLCRVEEFLKASNGNKISHVLMEELKKTIEMVVKEADTE